MNRRNFVHLATGSAVMALQDSGLERVNAAIKSIDINHFISCVSEFYSISLSCCYWWAYFLYVCWFRQS